MKLFSEHPGASISMTGSSGLRECLIELLTNNRITHVLESGTFDGRGSTTFIAESFSVPAYPEVFITIEANWNSWRLAKRNLALFPFVDPVWGTTVTTRDAIEFIQSDDFLHNHEDYPDIFIDNIDDPVRFYTDEIEGKLDGGRAHTSEVRAMSSDRNLYYMGDDLLARYLPDFRGKQPFIILDSAGGIGYLEFITVQRLMQDQPYFLLLDDIHHIKHYRSYRDVRRAPACEIIGVDENEGWMLARMNVNKETS